MIVTCPYAEVGCGKKMARADLDQHALDPSHMQLLLAAVVEGKKEVSLAKARAVQAEAELKWRANVETVPFSFPADVGSTSDKFSCGGVDFSVRFGKNLTSDLCVSLNFDSECTIRLKLIVFATIRLEGGDVKYRKVWEHNVPMLKLKRDGCGVFTSDFTVRKATDEWPKGPDGDDVVHFDVDVLIEKERRLTFD
jgi:hypothetical protein